MDNLSRGMLMENLENEWSLVMEMQAGNEKAFSELYLYYSPRMYTNIVRMVRDPLTAEEIVQEVFTRIWDRRSNIQIVESFAGYLYRASQNLVHDYFRKIRNDRVLLERFTRLATENYQHVEERLNNQESTLILQRAIDQLPPQQKKVYILVKEEGCTYKKAAEILGISAHTVKEYLVSGTKSVRTFVSGHVGPGSLILIVISVLG
jgi:RNA polymerase sigma-70 factor (family 1)